MRNNDEPSDDRKQVLADTFYLLYAVTLMMHPVVPSGCEKIANHMNVDLKTFFNWENIYSGIRTGDVWSGLEISGNHPVIELPPRTDFFRKHESQYKK